MQHEIDYLKKNKSKLCPLTGALEQSIAVNEIKRHAVYNPNIQRANIDHNTKESNCIFMNFHVLSTVMEIGPLLKGHSIYALPLTPDLVCKGPLYDRATQSKCLYFVILM